MASLQGINWVIATILYPYSFLAINQHFKFSHARPLHAAHGLRGFGNGILSGFGEALFGRTHNLDDFLGHGCLLSSNRSISLPSGGSTDGTLPFRCIHPSRYTSRYPYTGCSFLEAFERTLKTYSKRGAL